MGNYDWTIKCTLRSVICPVFRIGSAIVMGVCGAAFIGSLMAWGVNDRDVWHNEAYTDVQHQEYMIDNPSHKLFINDNEISRYDDISGNNLPFVVGLETSDGTRHEAVVKRKEKSDLIGNHLLISGYSS